MEGFAAEGERPVHSLSELLGKTLCAPRYEQTKQRLQDIVKSWSKIAGPAAHRSAPYDIAGGTLYVLADSNHAVQMLMNMKANIRRALKSGWGLDIENVDVRLGTTPSSAGRKNSAFRGSMTAPHRRHAVVEPSEEEIKVFLRQCPEDMDPDLAYALSRFRAFFVKRFPENNTRH